jgi:uroporphyrinogen decarboxylase
MTAALKGASVNKYFVPELLVSARATKGALELIRPRLAADGVQPVGRVVLGTVKGDLHDIGKNLVGAMLEGGGFEVIDLGVDVPPERFVTAVKDKHANIVAMSALLMAEPAAGLLSPRALAAFSSRYIQQIAAPIEESPFEIVLHNCAAKLIHLSAILETGLKAFHFGTPMDMAAALDRVPPDVVLCGNLDPASVFLRASPAEVTTRTERLLATTSSHRNFVVSSGCDLPPHVPLANLDAFYEAVQA